MRNRSLAGLVGVATLLLAGVHPAEAQERISFGVMAGMTQATLTGDNVDDTGWRTGLAAGLFFRVAESSRFVFEPQLLYVQKGTSFADTPSHPPESLRLNYFEIPLLLKLKLGPPKGAVRPVIFVAPAIGFKLSCNFRQDISGGGAATCGEAGLTARSSDLSAIAGLGVELGHLAVQLRYDRGLRRVFTDEGTVNAKNQTVLLAFGISLYAPDSFPQFPDFVGRNSRLALNQRLVT